MFLSTFTEREDDDSGNYFSYPQASNRLHKNIQVCLPRGFTSAGPEYQTYKDNCMDLMADQCSVEWGPLCNAYQSNLNKNEQELFKQYVDERSTSHPLAPNNSCTRQASSIVPGQVDIRGINPYVDQKTGLALPLSCPSKVNGSIQTSEFVNQQVYLHDQQKNRVAPSPFAYSSSHQNRSTKTTPIPFAPRPNGALSEPIPFYPEPTVAPTPEKTPIPFYPVPTSDKIEQKEEPQRVEVKTIQPALLPITVEPKEEQKEQVTPIPFLPSAEKPVVSSEKPVASTFMPEQLDNGRNQKKVSFNLPSSPVAMFVTDEAAINELIYGSDSSDCASKTACSISKIMN